MATIAGSVKSLSSGTFHAKDENGNIRVLQEGDTIYENDTVYGDNGNSSSSKIEILLSGNDVIVLSEGQKQLIDSSLIETAFGTEELFFTREGLDLKADEHNSNADVVSDLRDAEFTNEQKDAKDEGAFTDANNSDVTKEETAEGQEEAEDETAPNGEFQARDGNATDIVSDLRNAQFKARTQVFEDKSFFENESKDRLTSLENTDRPSYTNPPVPTPTPPTPTPPPVVTPPVIETPTVIIGNLSVNDVSSYESEGFLVFTVSLDKSVASPVTFDYVTSPITATNNGVDYTDVKGTITIPAGSTSITIKVPITDDYISDNGETMKINISNVVGNANISKPQGIGTILDNPVNNPSNGTTETPTEPGGYGQEDTVYAIITGATTVNEGNTTTYTVKLVDKDGNAVVVTNPTTVTVKYTNVTTQDGDTQFNNNNTINVTIPANGSSNTFTVESIDDYFADNGEKYNVAITKVNTNEFENVVIGDINGNNKDVTTEILDNSKDTPTDPYDQKDIPPVETDLDTINIKLFAIDPVTGARVPANEVLEGNDAEYIVVAFDKNNNEVLQGETVTVTFGKGGDTATNGGVDYVSTTQIVTIGTKFSTPTTDDYIADNGEFYSVQITDKTLSNASNYETVIIDTTSVTTMILDDSQPNTPNNPNDGIEQDMESVTVKLVSTDAQGNIIPEATIPEGKIAYYKAILVDPSGNQIVGATGTVDITFTDGTAIRTGTSDEGKNDFTATNQTVTLNTVFSAVANDDYIADNGETFNVQITDDTYSKASDYENVIHDTTPVVTTITDNSKPVDGNTPHDPNDTDEHTTESNKEIVTIKLFAADSSGNVIKDGSGNYVLANTADEDTYANYIAYAFNDGVSVYNDSTKLTTQVGKVDVSFTDGTAKGVITTQITTDGSQDFDNKAQTITIGESFSTKVFNDVLKEGTENYTVSIDSGSYAVDTVKGGYESVTIDTASVTTTINDSSAAMKVFVKIEPVTDTVNESGDLEYKVTLVDVDGNEVNVPTGKSITVDLTYTNVTTSNNDYTTPTTQVTITGGSSTNFTVPTVDDYFAEGDESLKIVISNITGDTTVFEEVLLHTTANGATSDKVEVDGTIKDNPANKVKENPGDTPTTGIPNEPTDPSKPVDPTDNPPIYGTEDTVYVKITEAPSTIEGGNLVHTVTLVDKDGNVVEVPAGQSVTVTLDYTAKSGDFTEDDLSIIIKTVTIAGGTNHTDFTNITKDDFTAEGDEVYTVTITDVSQTGAFENVAISSTNSTTGTIKDGVILGTPVNAKVYEDGLNTSATTENDLGKSLGITNPNADTYTVSFDKTITTTDKTSNGQVITYSYNTDGTILTARRADNKVVFTVELKKDGSGNDVYDFKLKTVMDHDAPPAGTPWDKNEFDMPFQFNVTSNGTTSSNKTFNVTVVDSVPSADPIIANTKEDTAVIVRLADDDFKNGEQVTINGVAHNIGATGIAIHEKGDTTKQIGSLTINTNGTVTFTPIEDYSNHDTSKSPEFTYTVKDYDGDEASSTVTINVKPVADAITITVNDVTSYEDASTYSDSTTGNAAEGRNKIPLGLSVPELSKDQTDENASGKTGDNPERNGEITLTFTNGDKVTGAKIFKSDGTTQVGNDITDANQTLKVIIINDAKTGVDYDYHHADITIADINTSPAGTVYLTKDEYEGLIIQHAEDNDTNIKIKIDATSYELDDSNKPLSTTDADLYETATANMTVKINPATDDISLAWDAATGGTISKTINDNDTFTFTGTQEEGYYFNNPIDLDAILSNTSGGLFGTGGTKADLDGSEKRTYTVTGIPEGTVIILGTQTAVANKSGIATLVFNNTNNQAADPEFSMKLPEHYSGTISNAKITLSVQDKGVDSGDTPSSIKTAEVYFNVTVTPVADLATIQVSQAVGFEDAGRDGGNTVAKDGTINANGTGGIPLDIKVSSDDKDDSETFDVTISGIPTGAVIYYDGAEKAGTSITILDFDNKKSLVIIPPHNSDADFTLNVSATTKDGGSVASPTVTTIDVIVKNVADAPVGTELKTDIKVDEDNQLNLKDVYTDSTALKSYDDSEVLTVKIDLPTGFTIDSGSPYYVEDGMYVVKASDITADKIMLNIPKDFSGNTTFDLTYVTTEKAGEGDSKTWNTDPVSIFVNPIADDVTVAESSTLNEDVATKVDLTATLKDTGTTYGTENIDNVYILKSSIDTMITQGYTLTVNGSNITSKSTENLTDIVNGADGEYYVLTHDEADKLSVINTVEHKVNGDFSLNVAYKVTDTKDSASDTKIYGHTHTVNVKAVTDAPTLTVGDITQVSGTVTIDNATDTVTVNADNSEFNVAVTTSSPDTDGSETVQKIVISGVPTGVSVEGATYYGYSGSEANGIWVITAPSETALDTDGALENIKFKINSGADFVSRPMTITTYTKDGADGEVKEDSKTINLVKDYTTLGTEPGNPAELELAVKEADITEDTEFTLADVLVVNEITAGDANGKTIITFTNIAEGTTVSGHDYEYIENGKTVYVVIGDGNAADMNTELSNVKITTPKDVNSQQDGALKGDFTLTADIVTYHNGGFNNGNTVTLTPAETISPLTDEMTISVTADNINEDGTSNISITLSNPSDGTKTELIGNSITIKVTENWLDSNANGEGTKGTLTQTGTDYIINDNNDGTYTITKTNGTPFTVDTPITGLQYTPATNRDGNVTFEVSVQNRETGSSVTLDSKGSTTISVTPIIDVELNASVVTAVGTEDTAVTVGSTTLANPVKLEIIAGTFTDGSEKIGNIILDEVPNGFTVWYKVGSDLIMATNIGETTGTFDLTPNISGDGEVHRNKWLIPASSDGSMPEVYINAPSNWSGDFDFITKFTISEQNLSTSTPVEVNVTGHINAVADGVTVDPTMTFGDAFSWVSLNLNANMKDTDGSETMTLELSGLDESAQFRYSDGTLISTGVTWDEDSSTWTIEGIAYDQINNIELLHDKSATVTVTASTVDTGGTTTDESSTVSDSFELKLSDVSGNFTLDSGVSLDFNKIAELSSINTLKNVSTIDLGQSGENKLENITLQDVLNMTDSSNTLKITGTNEDKVSFSDSGWSKTDGSGTDSGFDIYTNTNDNSVQVKVEQNIQDQII